MPSANHTVAPFRKDERVILHFDYDCFYASVFEAEKPELKSCPLAVQQKQIIVTCNYEARRRGLRKLQLITDAKRICPDVVIVLGEDISRFRDVSKELYRFLCSYSWSGRAERLGFDEVWLDVTDMIDYNEALLNGNDLGHSFFVLAKDDPTRGFEYDATCYSGPTYPEINDDTLSHADEKMAVRLRLGSHLAMHLRTELETQKGYTATVGISTNKLLSKLVGNLHKPKNQTTIIPPYITGDAQGSNVTNFMDAFEVGKIPGIGFQLAQKLRQQVLQHEPDYDKGLVYGATKEHVTVGQVRLSSDTCPEMLERLLAGPGSQHGIGIRIWNLLHGIDDTEVGYARSVPRQISIEDSYIKLDTLSEVIKELVMLSCSLLNRMRKDLLTEDDEDPVEVKDESLTSQSGTDTSSRRWLAYPKTIRLSTRPRPPLNADGTRTRSFKRISHSAPLPNFVFNQTDSIDALADKLVHDTLIDMFRRLHPTKAGWNLSLVNVAVTNMAETGGNSRTANGRDIGSMFKQHETFLKEFTVYDTAESRLPADVPAQQDANDTALLEQFTDGQEGAWVNEYQDGDGERCHQCGLAVPEFAMPAHQRYHDLGD